MVNGMPECVDLPLVPAPSHSKKYFSATLSADGVKDAITRISL